MDPRAGEVAGPPDAAPAREARIRTSPMVLGAALLGIFAAIYAVSPSAGDAERTLLGLPLAGLLIHASTVDLRHHIIPDADSLGLILVGLAATWWARPEAALAHAVAAAAWFGVLWCVSEGYLRRRRIDGFGLGDVKLMAAVGAWVGPAASAQVMAAASISAILLLTGSALRRSGSLSRLRTIGLPFGPFLALALWIVWLYRPLA